MTMTQTMTNNNRDQVLNENSRRRKITVPSVDKMDTDDKETVYNTRRLTIAFCLPKYILEEVGLTQLYVGNEVHHQGLT